MSSVNEARPAIARVGIVEDDPVLGGSLAAMVGAVHGCEVVGIAETLAEGRELAKQHLDMLLVDLALPDGTGLDLIAEVKQGDACKVLVISVFGDVRSVVRAIEAGADGYLLKGADVTETGWAIRTVLDGGAPISPAVAGHILARVRGKVRVVAPDRRASTPKLTLTAREIEIVEALAKGLSYKEVARLVGVSYHTVADHVKTIYRKLAVSSRGEAVFEAVQAGIIKLGD